MRLFQRLLITAPRMTEAVHWKDDQQWKQTCLPIGNATSAALALEHARQSYADVVSGLRGIDSKLEKAITTAAAMAAFLATGHSLFGEKITLPIKLAVVFLLLATLAAISGRRALLKPAPASVRDLIDGLKRVGEIEGLQDGWQFDWLARSIHLAIEGSQPIEEWMAWALHVSNFFVAAAVATLAYQMLTS